MRPIEASYPAKSAGSIKATAARLAILGLWIVALYPPGIKRKGKEPT
jgi:hypothetical protein